MAVLLCCPAFHNNLIEDGVTDAEDVDDDRVFQQRQQVVWHSLPEMEQEVLDLEQSIEELYQSGRMVQQSKHGNRTCHLLKVDIDGVVQDALAVCFIHHDQSVHLTETIKERNDDEHQLLSE